MKKIAGIVLFFLLINTYGKSQIYDFRFGFQLSPTFSWLTSNDNKINGNGSNIGLKLGMLGEFYFAENYALMTGLGLGFNQGGTLKHDEGGNFWSNSELSDPKFYDLPDGINLKYSIQYVEIPFGLRMRTREFNYVRYYAEIPVFQLGIATRARGDIEGGLSTEDENIIDDVNLIAVSWGLGGGIDYAVSPGTSLIAGIFYQNQFLDMTKDKGAVKSSGEAEDSTGGMGTITIRLGVMF